MAGVFQPNVFQNNVFQVDVGWDGTTVLMPEKTGPGGVALSRKRFDEITAAWRAQEALARKADEAKQAKAKKALREAAKQAEDALLAIQAAADEAEEIAERGQIVALTQAMDAALSATTLSGIVNKANEAKAYAAAMQDEEEEAIALLLLNG
jgi:hypothetical protein